MADSSGGVGGGSRARTVEALISAFKRSRPKAIIVVQADGTEKTVALRTGTTRWQHAAPICAAMLHDGADRVEMRDESGAVLDTYALEGKKGPAEPVAVAPEERMLRLMLRAQEVALDRQSSLFREAFATTTELMRGMVARIGQLEHAHTKVLAAQWDAVTAQAEAEATAEGSPGMQALTELAGAFSNGMTAKKPG